jgi:hypothetical protein
VLMNEKIIRDSRFVYCLHRFSGSDVPKKDMPVLTSRTARCLPFITELPLLYTPTAFSAANTHMYHSYVPIIAKYI